MNKKPTEEVVLAESQVVAAEVTIPDMVQMERLAKHLLDSKMFPHFKNEAEFVTAIEYGRELGLQPIVAATQLQVINGQLSMQTRAMMALAHSRAGVTWRVTESTALKCTIVFSRPRFPDHEESFTIQEAAKAGLNLKNNWKAWPSEMLFARCGGRGIKRIAPDATLGLTTVEEMMDMKDTLAAAEKDDSRPAIQAEVVPQTVEQASAEALKKGAKKKAEPPAALTGPQEPEPAAPEKGTAEVMAEQEEEPGEDATCQITLTTGSVVEVGKFEALKYFQMVKSELTRLTGSDLVYYTIMESHGFKKSNEIPLSKIPEIWNNLIASYKFQREAKANGKPPKK